MACTLEKHCLTRVKGGLVKKAASCTKGGLLLLMEHFYTTATTPTDYQDAALVCLMWHVYGRASDLSLVLKQGLSVSSNNVLFLRLIRVKASEGKGLSLYPDRNTFATCPVHAIAVALLMQSTPCISLLPQLTTTNDLAEPATSASIPLVDLLGGGCHVEAGIKQETSFLSASARAPEVHSYVNPILRNLGKAAGVDSELIALVQAGRCSTRERRFSVERAMDR
uniref:AlNc14C579G12208 protein n=1 Tax=Albugo laibachii Nc14 TaxID=890382 RepID=F0X1B7_9STRA|nr:AlNc14C579G12208 [Albugo laibachii Nc14]|eukprot:CCA27593.1 AlNc14C579G12208 [Albugo laibachii Nc14]